MVNISELQLLALQNQDNKNIYPFLSKQINNIRSVMPYENLKKSKEQEGILVYQKVLKQVKNRR